MLNTVREPWSPERLIAQWHEGDREEIFRLLFERYSRRVCSFFRRRGFSPEEANELTQEAFLSVWKGIARFREDASFETWLYRIVRNLWSNVRRYRGALKRSGDEAPLEEAVDAASGDAACGPGGGWEPEGGPLSALLAEERHRLLREAITRLPAEQQKMVLFRVCQDLKVSEISTVMRMPEGTVKSKLFKARTALRDDLGRTYATIEL
jgi:RNA polymerase sigma-70 factor (ECF subfamily)